MGSGVERILLGVTGGIAAYKSAEIVRRLKERGAEVQVVMTGAARQFVTPLTFQALSGRPVRTDLWDEAAEAAMGHIELARWADRILVAPASADFLARLAHGLASDLLTTLCLATDVPITVAPAMNRLMWANAATRANMALLAARGIDVIGPAEGDQACGETGPGRMVEPDVLAAAVIGRAATSGALAGRKVIVTAGPTRERIDPVRFITNRSSGKMGFAVAEAARDAGAEVILISGPVSVCTPRGVRRVDVETADQMLAAVNENLAAPTSSSPPRRSPTTGRCRCRRRRSRRRATRSCLHSAARRTSSRQWPPAPRDRSSSGSRRKPRTSSAMRSPSSMARTST